ncbi:hypothetical protein BZG36_02051 [Bifiguratus adelaidae]|uniref:Uncharacterized protein n=1 Tax=Bifiguratus adelaidae TaxID=1938954 RepID=A0A261Y1X7_9FUNG|nr:hypothetical protein BZG36_02051 [Bifiguratus adelaidae]
MADAAPAADKAKSKTLQHKTTAATTTPTTSTTVSSSSSSEAVAASTPSISFGSVSVASVSATPSTASSHTNTGAIAGGVIAAFIVLGLAAFLVVCFYRRKRKASSEAAYDTMAWDRPQTSSGTGLDRSTPARPPPHRPRPPDIGTNLPSAQFVSPASPLLRSHISGDGAQKRWSVDATPGRGPLIEYDALGRPLPTKAPNRDSFVAMTREGEVEVGRERPMSMIPRILED